MGVLAYNSVNNDPIELIFCTGGFSSMGNLNLRSDLENFEVLKRMRFQNWKFSFGLDIGVTRLKTGILGN